MEIVIREIDLYNQEDFGRNDSSFTVSSKLVLNAENGENYRPVRTDYAE